MDETSVVRVTHAHTGRGMLVGARVLRAARPESAPYRLPCLLALMLMCCNTFGYVVHLVQNVEVDGAVVETIDETHDTTVSYTTSNAVARSGYIFAGWTTSTKQEFAARDDWGRAYEQVSFTLYEPMTNTAHYVREDLDSDNDGMPDGHELYWYGNLDQTPASDTDGDGIGFALELELGLNPHFADTWRRGLMITSAQPKFFNLVVRCEPEGTLFATVTNNVAPGVSWTSEKFDHRTTQFAYWRISGVEESSADAIGTIASTGRDAFGRALDQVSFTMPGNDVEVVAVCVEDVEARAGLYWYGDAATGWESDTDGDGLTLHEEFELGLNPLFKDVYQGGIKTAARNPQFFKYILRCEPEGTLFATVTNNVAPGVVKTTAAYNPGTSQFAYWRVSGVGDAIGTIASTGRDAFGRALDSITFEMPTNDVEIVAVCRDDEEARQALYWYGDETQGWSSDTDGDGFTLREEISLGLNPLFADGYERGILCASRKPQFFKYTVRCEPEGAVFATVVEDVCPGVIKTTAAYNPGTSKFAYWKVEGLNSLTDAVGTPRLRVSDDFGRALDAVKIEMPTNDVEIVAYCVENEETRQALYWYGDETKGYASDTDGDGYTLKEELALGLNPLFADNYERGILSAVTGFELFTCIIRSEPEGALFATQKLNIGPGVTVTTPNCDEKTTDFASWYLNGTRQADEFGRAWNGFSFTMPATNTEAIAVTVVTEEERDSLYWYGRKTVSPASDTDGDGLTLADEMMLGTNPLFADTNQFTGVRHALSEELEVDLQPFEQMRGTIMDGEYVELFTSPLAGNEESSETFGPEACPLAVDVDGDGLFDLVVVSSGELRVFVNKGSAANPDFSEIEVGTGAWANFARLVAGMVRPIVVGADGVFYVSDGGGEIYKFTLADGAIIKTGLVGIPGVFDGRLIALDADGEIVCADAGYTMILDTPVLDGVSLSCADVDADGRTDILVSDTFGHIWLYRNTTTRTIKTEQFFTLQYKVWAGTGVGFADGIAISLVDWEDDGDYDVVLGTEDGKLMLLRDPRTGRPTNVRAYPGADNVLLEWDPNAQPRIRGYNVYRAPDAESYVRIVNQTPLPTYRDQPKVLQDYWYQITGVSRFYIAGNSTPTVNESMPTDAVYVQFRPSVWLNDTSSFTETNVEMIVSMNNSMGLSSDGFTMTFAYDPEVLIPVDVKATGLTDELKFKVEVEERTFTLSATGGEIGTGAGRFLRLVFYVKPVTGVDETTVSITAATVKAKDGHAVTLELPKSAKIEISERKKPEPAVVAVHIDDVVTETETEFEMDVTVTSTETLTNFTADVAYDPLMLEWRGVSGGRGATALPDATVGRAALCAPQINDETVDFTLKFYAKDPESVLTNLSTVVSLTNIVAVDCHGLTTNAPNALGTVLLKNVHPWTPATVSVSTEDKKVNTLEEVVVPFKVTSSAALKSGSFTIDWDESVLQLVGRAVPCAPLTIEATGDFSLTFLAKDQHTVSKTQVRLTSATVTDVHGFVISPTVPVTSTVLIHDAHPLVPAKVSLTLGDVKTKTEQTFEMTLGVTTTEALTNLVTTLSLDEDLLEIRKVTGAELRRAGGSAPYQLVAAGTVPEKIVLTFYAKENHEVKSSDVTITPVSGCDHNGLAAEFAGNAVGKVVFEDSNPWQPATVSVAVSSKKVDTLTEFEVPVTITSNQKLTNFVATVSWDATVLEWKGVSGGACSDTSDEDVASPLVIRGDGSNFTLKFYVKDQHAITSTAITLTQMSAVDEHGLTAYAIADASGTILIHDAHPLVPAKVSLTLGDVKTKTEKEFEMTLGVTTTEVLTNLVTTLSFDEELLEIRKATGAELRRAGDSAPYQLVAAGTVAEKIVLTFYAKENHEVKSSDVTITPVSGRDHNGLAAEFAGNAVGKVVFEDSNPWQPATVSVAVGSKKVDTLTEFEVPVTITSNQKLTNFVATVSWDATVLEWKGVSGGACSDTSDEDVASPLVIRGDGSNFKLKFYAKDQHTITSTAITLTQMSAVDEHGLTANPIADASGTVLIHDAHPLVPARVSLTLGDVKTKTEQTFEMTLGVTTTEALTNLVTEIGFDEALLELRGSSAGTLSAAVAGRPPYRLTVGAAVPERITLTFYAKENHEVKSSDVTITPVSGCDHNGLAAEFAGNAVGKVVFEDSNPWQPATVSVAVGSKKVDTLTEFEVPVTITSNQKLTNFVATVNWDATVLEWRGVEGATASGGRGATALPTVVTGTGSNFTLRFYAKNQHTVEKTSVGLANMSAVDEHGLTSNPIADAAGVVFIHDSQPLVPAEVAVKAGDVSVETRQNFTVPIAVTSTKTLTNLIVSVSWDATVLEWKGVAGATACGALGDRALPAGATNLVVNGEVPATILVTFYAKDQHTVKKTAVTLSEGAAVCSEGLAANVTVAGGTVNIIDSNPPVAANAAIGTWSVRVTSGATFELPVGRTADADMTDYTATLAWNSDLTYQSAVKATVTKHSDTAATFAFATSGTKSTDYVTFTAPTISGLQAQSWVKITAAGGTSANGLAAKMTTAYPVTSTVLIVREIGKYSPGDIDGDGKLTDDDVEKLKNYIKYQSIVKANPKLASKCASWNLTGKALNAADVNSDGSVNATDLSLLVQWVAEYKEIYK